MKFNSYLLVKCSSPFLILVAPLLLAVSPHSTYAASELNLPQRFNILEQINWPAKKQSWGTCWAFASLASLESHIFQDKHFDKNKGAILLSEYHMDKFSGFSRKGAKDHVRNDWYTGQGENFFGSNTDDPYHGLIVHLGGDFKVASAYLINNLGAVENSRVQKINSYKDLSSFGDREDEGILKYNNYQYFYPTKIMWLSHGSREEIRERIKNHLLNYGAVATGQYMSEKPLGHIDPNNEFHFYYGKKDKNHAITIVGWDDQVAHPPLLPGAWIVRDSDHRDDQDIHINQFYVSYFDKFVADNSEMGAVSFGGVREIKNQKIYSHSLHGWQQSHIFENKVKNRFFLEQEEKIRSVTFLVVKENEEVTINITDDQNKNICKTYTNKFENPGFYTIDLEECRLTKTNYLDIIQENKSNYYAVDSDKVFKLLLGNYKRLPDLGEEILVKSKSQKNESFYYQDEKWYDLKDNQIHENSNFVLYLITENRKAND